AGLPADRRDVGGCLPAGRHRIRRRLAVRPVRGGGWLPAHAAPDPHRHPLPRRGGLGRQPDARRLGLRPYRAMAAGERGPQDGQRAAGRRRARLAGGGAALRAAAAHRPGRPRRLGLLRGRARDGRRVDGDGERAGHPPPPHDGPPQAARAFLDTRPAAEDAVPALAALHLHHPALRGRLRHRRAVGGDGGGRRLHARPRHDLLPRHADLGRHRHLAVPGRLRRGECDDAAGGAARHGRHPADHAAAARRRRGRTVRRLDGDAAARGGDAGAARPAGALCGGEPALGAAAAAGQPLQQRAGLV
ncbi:MAG: Sulfite exporter TauE/SafE, partial [uncultured Craurococcus sp.]